MQNTITITPLVENHCEKMVWIPPRLITLFDGIEYETQMTYKPKPQHEVAKFDNGYAWNCVPVSGYRESIVKKFKTQMVINQLFLSLYLIIMFLIQYIV